MFKVGDWVTIDGEVRRIYKLFPNLPNHAQFSEIQEDGTSSLNEYELWKPRQGEWCWWGLSW